MGGWMETINDSGLTLCSKLIKETATYWCPTQTIKPEQGTGSREEGNTQRALYQEQLHICLFIQANHMSTVQAVGGDVIERGMFSWQTLV